MLVDEFQNVRNLLLLCIICPLLSQASFLDRLHICIVVALRTSNTSQEASLGLCRLVDRRYKLWMLGLVVRQPFAI